MAAPSETYVDPSIAAASGAGTIGDPYGDLQHALDTITRDGTNGDRINVKAGTDEVLAASLDLTTYGTPNNNAPLVIQGYTSTADDQGIGGIDCNSASLFSSTVYDYIALIDLHIHNGGSANLISLDNDIFVIRCEINNTSGHAITVDQDAHILGCNIHDIGAWGIDMNYGVAEHNYLKNGTKTFTIALNNQNSTAVFKNNIISIGGSSNGITLTFGAHCINNSILSSGGTGIGITMTAGNDYMTVVHSNLIEGFSGVGGIGLSLPDMIMVENCGVYNCTTAYSISNIVTGGTDNETLGASPFAKSGSDTFANRFTYFAPVDTGNVFGGAYQ